MLRHRKKEDVQNDFDMNGVGLVGNTFSALNE